jgi:uracil-DNA glycosylase
MIYTLRFDQAALHLIGEALGQMPHRAVAALIGNIQSQINAQEAAAAAASRNGDVETPAVDADAASA